MDLDSGRGIARRLLLGWGGLAGAAVVAAGVSLAADQPVHADMATSVPDRIPPDTCPGGAYDRYIAKLAADDKFSGVVVLSHRGRTVLSRSYGMADKEKGIVTTRVSRSTSTAGRSSACPLCSWRSRGR